MMHLRLKYLFISAFIILSAFTSFSQEKLTFSIADFYVDPFDISARDKQYEKYDGSGDRYAIIKVSSNNPDDNLKEYTFDFGHMKHLVEEHDGILWIYVQRNAKLVTIRRDGYATLHKYPLNTTIESGKNYIMSITSEAKRVYTQMVQFNVLPANSHAVIMVKNTADNSTEELFGNTDATGAVAKNLVYGTYSYKVLADNYHMSEGRFTLNNKSATHIENITLRPNYSDITLDVDADADIYVNGEQKGTRRWSGALKAGNYHIECRQTNHKPTSQYITVTENDNRTINLQAPEAIVGTASVTSNPLGAEISIDGKEYGITPRNIDLIVGRHSITLSKIGHKTEKREFDISENRTTEISATLGRTTTAAIKSNPIGASLYIDGNYKGNTPYTFTGEIGDHKVKLFKPGYKPVEKKIYFGNTDNMSFSLKKQYTFKNDIYIEVGAGVGSAMNLTAAIGAHISNFNIEAYYSYCLQDSPDIYWIDPTADSYYVYDDYSEYGYEYEYGYDSGYYTCKYSPSLIIGGKLGYGIIVGTRIKITPQIGYRFVKLTEDAILLQSFINGANCSGISIGTRAYFAFSSHFGISLTPEYIAGISKSEGFKTLSQVSSKIKNFGEGFNANLSLVLTF